MTGPEEPIALSAPLARQLARRLCRRDPLSGEDCSWYHGLWQDLRAMGMAATPEGQMDFFLGAFRRLANQGRPRRVLISGSADYSILAHVLWASNEHRVQVDLTVIDVCETPLFLNQWYADRTRVKITTVREDIFAFRPGKPFDVICSHSFLGQFAPDRQRELIVKWWSLLAVQGAVLTINRVRPGSANQEVRFTENQANEFCQIVDRKIQESHSFTDVDSAEILARARVYVQRLRGYAITTAGITALLQENGFRIDDVSAVVAPDVQSGRMSGPAIPGSATHLCILATRRGSG